MKNKFERKFVPLASMLLHYVLYTFVNFVGLNICIGQPKLIDVFTGSTLYIDYKESNTLLVVRVFEGSKGFNPFAIDPNKPNTVIGAVFNEALADSLICLKINEVRFDCGLSTVYPSGKLRKYVSQKNSSIMVRENRLFHPELPQTLE